MNVPDPPATVTGLNVLLVSLAVLIILYNIWMGWRSGVVRQVCRVIAMIAGYLAGALLGPIFAPLLTFVKLPEMGVKAVSCIATGVLTYLVIRGVTNMLFRKTGDQESGFIRLIYGAGGAVIGLFLSAFYLLIILAGIRMTGTVAETQMEVAKRRHETFPPGRLAYVGGLVRAKSAIENGPAGPLATAIDPTPDAFYSFLRKLTQVTADPEAMRRFLDFPGTRELMAQPVLQRLGSNLAVQKMITERNFAGLIANPEVAAALRDERLRPLLQKFELNRALDYSLTPGASLLPASTPQPPQPAQPVERY